MEKEVIDAEFTVVSEEAEPVDTRAYKSTEGSSFSAKWILVRILMCLLAAMAFFLVPPAVGIGVLALTAYNVMKNAKYITAGE
ncbi:MAG: hypothetical protein IKD69_11050 [Solobacterium sp.]|nr:hypothetical protein [Solobacterium sp.]